MDGTPSANDMPARMQFHTTPDGGQTAVERMRIDSSGQVGIGTTSLGSETLTVAKSSGTPTIRISAPSGSEAQLKLQADGGGTDIPMIAAKTDGSLAFSRWTGAAYTERMRIDNDGVLVHGKTAKSEFTKGTTIELNSGGGRIVVTGDGGTGGALFLGNSTTGNVGLMRENGDFEYY